MKVVGVPNTPRQSSTHLTWLWGILFVVAAICFALGIRAGRPEDTRSAKNDIPVAVELDIKSLVKARYRDEVENIVGKPRRYERCCKTDNDPKFDVGKYNWGDVMYTPNNHVHSIVYQFKSHPHSAREALRAVGLDQTSEPLKVAYSTRWCPECSPSSPALIYDGIRFHDVTLWDDRGHDGFETIDMTVAD